MLIPKWTERITDRDVVGEDHLGVENAASNYQDELIPGITTVTTHARYDMVGHSRIASHSLDK